MSHFETTIEIRRPREEVFGYVADPRRFAEWNAAVESVVPLPDAGPAAFVMRRRLPAGPTTNHLLVTERPPEALTIGTTTGLTPFTYHYTFETTSAGTLIKLSAHMRLGRGARLIDRLAAQAVRRGVDANLAALRDILERDN